MWTCPGTSQGQNWLLQKLNGHQQALGLMLPSLTSCVVTALHEEAFLSLCLRKWQLTPVLLLGKFHGWRSLAGYSPQDCKESDMTERLYFKGERCSPGQGIWSFPQQGANSQPERGLLTSVLPPHSLLRARRGRRLPGRGGGARAPNTRKRVLSRECPQTAPLGSSGSVRHTGVAGSVELIHKEMKTMRWEVTGQKALG